MLTNVSGDTALNNLAVLACGIALAAQALAVTGSELGISGGEDEAAGSGGSEGGAGAEDGDSALQQLCGQAGELLQFLAETHRAYCAADIKQRSHWLSHGSLHDMLHAQAAIGALA